MPVYYIPRGQTELERINEILSNFLSFALAAQKIKEGRGQQEAKELAIQKEKYAEPYKAIKEAGGLERAYSEGRVTCLLYTSPSPRDS